MKQIKKSLLLHGKCVNVKITEPQNKYIILLINNCTKI